MAKKNDAKRAQKKHAKEKKRQKALSARTAELGRTVTDRWKPRAHGIEGLARLLKLDAHDAAGVADLLAVQRKDARVAWLPSRVRALSTEALLAELAGRGIITNEGAFVALASTYESARALAAENWHGVTTDVHHRDLAGEAAEELWARWLPGTPTDEQLRDRWGAAIAARYDDPRSSVAALLAILEGVGTDRVARAGGDPGQLLRALASAGGLYGADADEDARVDHQLLAWRAAQTVGTAAWASAVILVAQRRPFDEQLAEILDRLAEAPTTERLLAFVHDAIDCDGERGPLRERLDAAYETAIAAASDPHLREWLEGRLAELRDPQLAGLLDQLLGDDELDGADFEDEDEDDVEDDEEAEDEDVETLR